MGDEWIGVGVGVSVWGGTPCRQAHAHTCMLNMINMDDSMRVGIWNFYKWACVNACACVHIGGHPHAPDAAQSFFPSSTPAESTKHQN